MKMKKQQNSNDYNVNQGTPPAGNDQQTGYEHYESSFKERAGNDLPQQLSYEGNGKETYDLILGGRIIAELHTGEDEAIEICKAYNDFPTLQEQNKELLEALTEMVSEYGCFSDVPANLKSFPGYTGENPREQAMVRALNLISKYSK